MSKDAIVDAAKITERREYDNGLRRQADGDLRESLQQQLESQQFIARLSATFINPPADKVMRAIHSEFYGRILWDTHSGMNSKVLRVA